MGLNFLPLRCHHDELVIELESISHKPNIMALTETGLTKSYTENLNNTSEKLENLKDYSIATYQLIHSTSRKKYKLDSIFAIIKLE